MSNDTYVSALSEKLNEVNELLDAKRADVRKILEEIQLIEVQAEHILHLLESEGVSVDEISTVLSKSMSVSDMAYEVLSNRDEQKPLHYRRIANLVTSEGRLIPGKDPAANLVSHISRDPRFVRTARGTYGLADWGLKPTKKSVRKRKRKQ